MIVTTNAPAMVGTTLLKGSVSPASETVGFDYGNGNLDSHIEFDPGSPGDFEYPVSLQPNLDNFQVRAKALNGGVWVNGDTWQMNTTSESKFGGGKTLDQ